MFQNVTNMCLYNICVKIENKCFRIDFIQELTFEPKLVQGELCRKLFLDIFRGYRYQVLRYIITRGPIISHNVEGIIIDSGKA